MSKMLTDGESRQMMPKFDRKYVNSRVKVVAHRVDCDTPYVLLTVKGHDGHDVTVHLEDIVVDELIGMLKRALDILPSSK